MITEVEFDDRPMDAGEVRVLRAWATQSLVVHIECFRQPPQPPQLRSCAECGSFPAEPGQGIRVAPSVDAFRDGGGFMRITISDLSGDTRQILITVRSAGLSSPTTPGSLVGAS